MALDQTCDGCKYMEDNNNCSRFVEMKNGQMILCNHGRGNNNSSGNDPLTPTHTCTVAACPEKCYLPYPKDYYTIDSDETLEIDSNNFTQQDFEYITKLSQILDNERGGLEQELIHFSDDPEFELGNLKITINNLKTSENELIECE